MIRAAVSLETRTLPPFSTLLAVWKLTPALAATSLIETYRRGIPSCLIRIYAERTFACTVNPQIAGGQVSIRHRSGLARTRQTELRQCYFCSSIAVKEIKIGPLRYRPWLVSCTCHLCQGVVNWAQFCPKSVRTFALARRGAWRGQMGQLLGWRLARGGGLRDGGLPGLRVGGLPHDQAARHG